MGAMVSLGVGRFEIDWGKNNFFTNHSALFLPGDVGLAPYFYAEGVVENRRAFVRPLRSVVSRLEMLGYSIEGCRQRYAQTVEYHPDYYPQPRMTFDQFSELIGRVDAARVGTPEEGDHDLGECAGSILRDPEFTKTRPDLANLDSDEGTFLENLDPYITLRLLAQNPVNLNLDVVWGTEDVVEAGWVEQGELYQGIPTDARCLVVTEGSSDGHVLEASLPLVLPDLRDFFNFIDMTENYPFTGTGNVVKFCQGLARINVQNRILVVLDNDTAGRDAYMQLSKLALPSGMRVTQLPTLERFRKVKTLGPSGAAEEDINGRAVAIECFLDIWSSIPEPVVRWSSYNSNLGAYQGALVNKDAYVRRFFDRRPADAYDLSGLSALWRQLVATCTAPQADVVPQHRS